MHRELKDMQHEIENFMESIKPANPELIGAIGDGVGVIIESWLGNLLGKKKRDEQRPEPYDLETESPIGTLVEKGSDRWTTADKDIDKAFVDGIVNKIEYLINQGEGATLDYLFKKIDAVRPEFEKREKYSRHSAKDDAFVKSMVESLTEDDLEVYTLPAYWAAPLVNDDFSGLEDEEIAEIEQFLHNNKLGHCAHVSDVETEVPRNDANNKFGDVAKFTFIKLDKGGYEDQAQEPTSFVGLESIGDIIPNETDGSAEEQKPSFGEARKQLDALEKLIEGCKVGRGDDYKNKRHDAHLLLERIKGMEKSPKQEQRFELLDRRLAAI